MQPARILLLGFLLCPALARAQGGIVRDGTVGSGVLEVGAGVDPLGRPATYLITPELGEQRGGNLFHSFARFGVGEGEVATFTGPASVENVISRVTGGAPSQIDGTLRSTIPGADVWLLNPSGVVFGEHASVDVPGSFHAGSADFVELGGSGLERFYGDPSLPSVLSTASPRAFGFLPGSAAGELTIDRASLEVLEDETLELAGGSVSLRDAELRAPAGHVALESPGEVALRSGSLVDVGRPGDTPGTISIRGGQVVVAEGSRVMAENESAIAEATTRPGPGSITIAAGESVLVDDGLTSASTSAAGNAGTIRIGGLEPDGPRPDVTVQNGPGIADVDAPEPNPSGLRADTTSSGAAGEIAIDASALVVQSGVGLSAGAVGAVPYVWRGPAGRIEIHADSIRVADRALIAAAGWGSLGPSGAISIDLPHDGAFVVDGSTPDGVAPGRPRYAWILAKNGGTPGSLEIRGGAIRLQNGGMISTDSNAGYPGGSGPLRILGADSVVLTSGGLINSHTENSGNGGDITIEAGVIEISGGQIASGAQSAGTGNAGDIRITAGSLEVRDGGMIQANVRDGSGDAGDIAISAGSLDVRAGGFINASGSFGGYAGTITVDADTIHLEHGRSPFSLATILDGTAADITGIFSATIFGGAGGRIRLSAAREIEIADGAFVSTTSIGGGAAGTVELDAPRIHLIDGGFIDSTSMRALGIRGGPAGDVLLRASDSIEISGRRDVVLHGQPIQEWSHVGSTTLGSGTPGSVTLEAPRVVIDGGAALTVAVDAMGSAGGDISVRADELALRNGGRIDASTFIDGPGGRIDLEASRSIRVDGAGSAISSRTGGSGAGGDIALRAPGIEVTRGGEISATSESGLGAVGDVFASLVVERFIFEPAAPATGDAGSIALQARRLVHLDAGSITTASPSGPARGGNISIDPELVLLEHGSRIVATADEGAGGRIEIVADRFVAYPGSLVSADSGRPELSGSVEIHSPDVNVADSLKPLSATYLDATSLLHERCAARRAGASAGSFAVGGAGGIAAEPAGWLRAPVLPEAQAASEAPAPATWIAALADPRIDTEGCR